MKQSSTTQFETRGWWKHAERDDFENGCDSSTATSFYCGDRFVGSTIAELIQKLCEFFDVSEDDIELDACDEPGRLDLCRTETAEGYNATREDVKRWRRGEKDLYYAIYTFHVEQVTRRIPALTEEPHE